LGIDEINSKAKCTRGRAVGGSHLHCLRALQIFLGTMALAAVVSICGCGRGGANGNGTTDVSPSDAAQQAMELLDKDGSGALDEKELAASPGILALREQYDSDGNQQISEDEIAARLESIYRAGAGWLTVTAQVLQGTRPLAGAKVRFVPEPFLDDALKPASATTDGQGRLTPAVADEQLPADMKGLTVMRQGIYRVEVEHPSIKQPHKPLGCEISGLTRGGTEPVIRL
jgi:hypothetical protein